MQGRRPGRPRPRSSRRPRDAAGHGDDRARAPRAAAVLGRGRRLPRGRRRGRAAGLATAGLSYMVTLQPQLNWGRPLALAAIGMLPQVAVLKRAIVSGLSGDRSAPRAGDSEKTVRALCVGRCRTAWLSRPGFGLIRAPGLRRSGAGQGPGGHSAYGESAARGSGRGAGPGVAGPGRSESRRRWGGGSRGRGR